MIGNYCNFRTININVDNSLLIYASRPFPVLDFYQTPYGRYTSRTGSLTRPALTYYSIREITRSDQSCTFLIAELWEISQTEVIGPEAR